MAGNSAVNLINRDPANVVLAQEMYDLKHGEGCAVCRYRNTKHVFGHYVCDDPTRQPLKGCKFCHRWEYDEAIK